MTTQLPNDLRGTVLVVDDDASMRNALRLTLGGLGFTIVEAACGEEAISLVRATRFDAVLLDVNLPGMGGVETCRRIRRAVARLPILMLTVLDSEDDKILALEAGADDYITKPFQIRELTARLRSAVRRRNAEDGNQDVPVACGEIELDPVRHRVLKSDRSVHLTPKEFELLHYLMIHAGEPIPHSRLLKAVWGPEYGSEFEYLRTFVRQLRKKIEDDPSNPRYLHTDSSIGYRFNKEPHEALR